MKRAITLLLTLALVACDSGYKGELQTKPAYADMSGLYYHVMCKPDAPEYSDRRTRALRVRMDTERCAVLHLDGVERDGELMIYPGNAGNFPECRGLVEKLVWYRAHELVLARVERRCGARQQPPETPQSRYAPVLPDADEQLGE